MLASFALYIIVFVAYPIHIKIIEKEVLNNVTDAKDYSMQIELTETQIEIFRQAFADQLAEGNMSFGMLL